MNYQTKYKKSQDMYTLLLLGTRSSPVLPSHLLHSLRRSLPGVEISIATEGGQEVSQSFASTKILDLLIGELSNAIQPRGH
jgi:hypothetical protein